MDLNRKRVITNLKSWTLNPVGISNDEVEAGLTESAGMAVAMEVSLKTFDPKTLKFKT
jgi:hypothetical protein